jgi:hypothetical protein
VELFYLERLKYFRESVYLSKFTYTLGVALRGCLGLTQKLYTPSHRMFGDIHGALNIDKKITNCTVCIYFARRIF